MADVSVITLEDLQTKLKLAVDGNPVQIFSANKALQIGKAIKFVDHLRRSSVEGSPTKVFLDDVFENLKDEGLEGALWLEKLEQVQTTLASNKPEVLDEANKELNKLVSIGHTIIGLDNERVYGRQEGPKVVASDVSVYIQDAKEDSYKLLLQLSNEFPLVFPITPSASHPPIMSPILAIHPEQSKNLTLGPQLLPPLAPKVTFGPPLPSQNQPQQPGKGPPLSLHPPLLPARDANRPLGAAAQQLTTGEQRLLNKIIGTNSSYLGGQLHDLDVHVQNIKQYFIELDNFLMI